MRDFTSPVSLPNHFRILNQRGGNGGDLIGGEGERFGILLLRRVTAQVAIYIEGEGLLTVERVGIVEVEFRCDKEHGANLLVADIWRDIYPRVCHTVEIAVSDVRGRLEVDDEVFIDFYRIVGLDIRDN